MFTSDNDNVYFKSRSNALIYLKDDEEKKKKESGG